MAGGIAFADIDLDPSGIIWEYRAMKQRFGKKDKWIGFACSLVAHVLILIAAGVVFIKPAQFGVDLGLSSLEVQLVAGTHEVSAPKEVVKETPPIIEEKVIAPEQAFVEPEPQKIVKEEPLKATNLGNAPINAVSTDEGAITRAQPDYLRNPAPRYPLTARQNGWEGVVLLQALVDKSGRPIKVEIKESSGHAILDEAALKTVKTWRFRPAQLGAIPVESSVQVPIRFELKNSKN